MLTELGPIAEPTSGETWDMTPKRRPDCSGLAKSSGCALGRQYAAREADSRLMPCMGPALAAKGECRGVEWDSAALAGVLSRAGLPIVDAPATHYGWILPKVDAIV